MLAPILTVLTQPAPVITLADVKVHLRVDFDDDDTDIADKLAAATAALDGPDGELGRSIGQQTVRMTAGHFPGAWSDGVPYDWSFGRTWGPQCHPFEVWLPCPPIQSVTGVTYLDANGAPQTIDPATYALADRILFPLAGAAWPTTAWRPDAVAITYVAGYADGTLPAPIRAAILLMTADLYRGRVSTAMLAGSTADRLLATYRVFR